MAISGEGDAVVIDTPVSLVVGSSAPPVATIGTRLTATHVTSLSIVDAPLSGDTVDVRREVDDGIVEGELFEYSSLTEAVFVTDTEFQSVRSCFTVGIGTLS